MVRIRIKFSGRPTSVAVRRSIKFEFSRVVRLFLSHRLEHYWALLFTLRRGGGGEPYHTLLEAVWGWPHLCQLFGLQDVTDRRPLFVTRPKVQ